MDWMGKIKNAPERIFIVHGEKESAEALQKDIKKAYDWDAEIPQLYSIENV
jgi:metallo-beta-lactamase family protein